MVSSMLIFKQMIVINKQLETQYSNHENYIKGVFSQEQFAHLNADARAG